MAYKLGKRSNSRLDSVHPDLARVVRRAIQITGVDFTVMEGVRTVKRQQQLLDAGSSWTMDSRHMAHEDDGLSRAVDLGVWVGGRVDWSWPGYYKIARAMQRAARELNIPVRWGGAWVRLDLGKLIDPYDMFAEYVAKRKAMGKKAHADGPHFELPKGMYP